MTNVSTTETTTTLMGVDDATYTLKTESVVELAGRKMAADPQVTNQRFNGVVPDPFVKTVSVSHDQIIIDSVAYPCQVRQTEVTGAVSRTRTRLFYSNAIEPYVLRRESSVTDLDNPSSVRESTVEVIALAMPYPVLSETKSTAHLKLLERDARGTTITLAVNSLEVPGGVVAQTSKELDIEGQLVRRSTMQLLDYHIVQSEPTQPRRPLRFRRRRSRD